MLELAFCYNKTLDLDAHYKILHVFLLQAFFLSFFIFYTQVHCKLLFSLVSVEKGKDLLPPPSSQ